MSEFVASNSKGRLSLIVLGAVAFVVAGLWMGGLFGPPPTSIRYTPVVIFWVGWFGVVFFGLCAIIAVRRFFDPAAQLEIGPAGIRSHAWSDELIPWSEITDVTTWSFQRQKCIILHLRDADRFPGRRGAAFLASVNRKLTHGDIAISMTGTNRSFNEAMAAIARFRH